MNGFVNAFNLTMALEHYYSRIVILNQNEAAVPNKESSRPQCQQHRGGETCITTLCHESHVSFDVSLSHKNQKKKHLISQKDNSYFQQKKKKRKTVKQVKKCCLSPWCAQPISAVHQERISPLPWPCVRDLLSQVTSSLSHCRQTEENFLLAVEFTADFNSHVNLSDALQSYLTSVSFYFILF